MHPDEFREIGEQNDLTFVETTSASNGYPSYIKPALIGFDNFEQAQNLADQTGASIQVFQKKDGWQLWYRTGVEAFEALSNSAEDYGDNFSEEHFSSEEEVLEDLKETLRDLETPDFETLETFISDRKEIWEEIENADLETEIVISNYGKYFETIPKRSMNWSHDTKHLVIGLIQES